MKSLKGKVRLVAVVCIALSIGLAGLYNLLRPISNGCAMTYMYPTYIPISTPQNMSSSKYGLYLYHEEWRKIDFDEHLKKLSGVPVLFIPGNGGSYKQVRSLGAESDRAYQAGPLEANFYQTSAGEGINLDLTDISIPNRYTAKLDWFAVDLEGEHSAMDGRILQEHTEYVVYAVHRILDQYKESHDARVRQGASVSSSLPKDVILVGHSMGGFVARAAIVHPQLKKSFVKTILTLSTPHQFPPVALQPSLGHYYALVNREWRKGYEVQTSQGGRHISDPLLSHVGIVSISGGYNDYQVRSQLESLDSIVPHTHGFTISSTSIKNVWLSMEHQVILWCNQLAVQVSHTLLSLIDPKTSQPFNDVRHRIGVFTKMLHNGLLVAQKTNHVSNHGSTTLSTASCPNNTRWNEDELEKDLYIDANTVTILAMDGRRRWLDIHKLGSGGKNHFMFVTNLLPCSGVRLHLWREKGISATEFSANKRVVEITRKMVHIPSGPAPRQIEPGSQSEQASPSAVLLLSPQDMEGFRFLTISVAPFPTLSGRPPPATSMGIGQFFNPEDRKQRVSPYHLIPSPYSIKNMDLNEDHPLALNLTFSVSLGLLPVSFSLKPTGCGIKKSEFIIDEAEDIEGLCRLRCFPPVALAWDATSGMHVFPNLHSKTIVVDSSRASDETTVLLLVDPHCSYRVTLDVSITAAAARFLLLYFSQIGGLSVAIVFFALMRQAHAWEFDHPIPSLLSAVESNLGLRGPFFLLGVLPVLFAVFISCLTSQSLPPVILFSVVSVVCYVFSNGAIVVLVSLSQLFFYVAGNTYVFIKKRWQILEGMLHFRSVQWAINISPVFLSIKVVRIVRVNTLLITAVFAIVLVYLVHPALGLFVLIISHAFCCHDDLSSFLMASFRSHGKNKELNESGDVGPSLHESQNMDDPLLLNEPNIGSPGSNKSYCDTQLEIFHHRHGLLILHLLATLMFGPSLVAWFQQNRIGRSLPWLWDSALCTGVILHGLCDSMPEFNFFLFPIPGIPSWEIRLSFVYLLAGYYSYLSALALSPYRAFYPMAVIGILSFTFRIIQKRNREKGETYHRSRKHSHRH